MSTEFAPSEFMLLAKFLSKEYTEDEDNDDNGTLPLQVNPTIPESFLLWASSKKAKYYQKLIIEEGIFSGYELSRQVHLNFTLNIMSTYISDFYNRNEVISRHLEEYSEKFDRKDEVFEKIEFAANQILKLKLKKKSYWYNKANMFSLLCLFIKNENRIKELNVAILKERLDQFETSIPAAYQIAAKEGVNNKQERLIRNRFLEQNILQNA